MRKTIIYLLMFVLISVSVLAIDYNIRPDKGYYYFPLNTTNAFEMWNNHLNKSMSTGTVRTTFADFSEYGNGSDASLYLIQGGNVTLPDNLSQMIATNKTGFAVSMWFNKTIANEDWIFDIQKAPVNFYARYEASGKIRAVAAGWTGSIADNNQFEFLTSGTYTDGSWHNLIFNWDNTTGGDNNFSFWIDGEQIGSMINFNLSYTFDNENTLGRESTTLDGQLDHVMFFNESLSYEEMSGLYHFGYPLITKSEEIIPSNIIERSIITHQLILTRTVASVTNASLIYNNTLQTLSKVSNATTDIYSVDITHPTVKNLSTTVPVLWNFNYSLDGEIYNTSIINRKDVIHQMILGQCNVTPPTNKSLNFSFLSEENNNPILLPNFEASFTIWNSTNPTYTRNYGFNNASLPRSWYEICMYPDWTTFTTNYEVIVTATGMNDASYIVNEGTISLPIEQINIYMTNSTTSTAITTTTVDENDIPLVGYTIEAHRFDLANNNFTLIDIQTAGTEGVAIFNLDVSTSQYKFVVRNLDGEIVHTEPKQKLTQTSYVFRVILGTAPTNIQTKIYYLDIDFTADKPSKTFTAIFVGLDDNANDIRMVTRRVNSTNDATIDTQTSTDDSGVLTYTITDNTDDISVSYIATIYINSSDDWQTYVYDQKTIDYRKEWAIFGGESLFVSFLFIGTMTLIGFAVSATFGLLLLIFGFIIMVRLGLINLGVIPVMSLIAGIAVLLVRLKR